MQRRNEFEETICAISTPFGEGGIGIVRLSGSEAFTIVQKIFKCSKKNSPGFPQPRYLYHGYIMDNDLILDEVLVSFMPSPNTYTCEDIVEINCHSGVIALRAILELVLNCGARLAEPGEFTKRAFLNGRIDLSQAEAVMSIVKARSDEAARIAIRTLGGELTERIQMIRGKIVSIRAPIEASFDYPEEFDENDSKCSDICRSLGGLYNDLDELLRGVERNRAYQEGTSIAIIGRPNVGKSSLLNALLRQNRAIVHELPGTTRDMLEGFMNLGGYPLKLVDTAGIQGTEDPVEKEGIDRSRAAASMAKMLIAVIDGSVPLTKEDKQIAGLSRPDQGLVVVINKKDLDPVVTPQVVKEHFGDISIVQTAAINNDGIELLEEAVTEQLDRCFGPAAESSLLVSFRHEEIVKEALQSVGDAINAFGVQPLELISLELQKAWQALGEITGETVSEDLLDRIFSQFCLGK